MNDDNTFSKFLSLLQAVCKETHPPDNAILKEFCDLFFTLEEQEMLSSRYLVVKALLNTTSPLPQRDISKLYKVSIAQITRGSNALKKIDPKLKKFLDLFFHSTNELD